MAPVSKTYRHWRARIVDHVPLPLLTHAHEAGIAVSMMLVSAPLLNGRARVPESIHDQLPQAIAISWAWGMMAGSILTLVGLFFHRPRAEWAGQLILGHVLIFYVIALVANVGVKGWVTSCVFLVIGLVSWWRTPAGC